MSYSVLNNLLPNRIVKRTIASPPSHFQHECNTPLAIALQKRRSYECYNVEPRLQKYVWNCRTVLVASNLLRTICCIRFVASDLLRTICCV